MSLRDAAQQALEFLRTRRLGAEAHITALGAALVEPAPEPVAIGTVGELFTNAAWQRLDLRPSTKVYTNAPQRQPLYVCSRSDCPTRITFGSAT